MKFGAVRDQISEIYTRAIRAGISVRQNVPKYELGAPKAIGTLKSTTIALKNIPYADIYAELDGNEQFHLKLIDGALLHFQYMFDGTDDLFKHRLAYFPCPTLPTREEAPELYDKDDLYGEILLHRIVRFPIRFDYDPKNYKPVFHSHSHLTLGQFDNCRIPATHPVSPNAFFLFIVRNFYSSTYRRYRNIFDQRITHCPATECITESERMLTTLSVGR